MSPIDWERRARARAVEAARYGAGGVDARRAAGNERGAPRPLIPTFREISYDDLRAGGPGAAGPAAGGRSAERPERVRVEGVFSRTRPRASGDGGV